MTADWGLPASYALLRGRYLGLPRISRRRLRRFVTFFDARTSAGASQVDLAESGSANYDSAFEGSWRNKAICGDLMHGVARMLWEIA